MGEPADSTERRGLELVCKHEKKQSFEGVICELPWKLLDRILLGQDEGEGEGGDAAATPYDSEFTVDHSST
jgi:hypothetical protein